VGLEMDQESIGIALVYVGGVRGSVRGRFRQTWLCVCSFLFHTICFIFYTLY